ATGQLLKLDPANGAVQATLAVGANPRHVSAAANGALVLVSRFITAALPGEGTATVDTSTAGGEVVAVNAGPMTPNRSIVLRHSDRVDNENQGSGVPNYLAAAVISPDGTRAWVPSKQDNIRRGTLRQGQPLDFQNTVRAISSRIDMATLAEDGASRIDHDNASLGTAAAYHPSGAYLFVALETSRQVAVVDAFRGRELFKFDVGRAPQALAVSADGTRLYVQNFMDRTASVIDLGPLVREGLAQFAAIATVATTGAERLSAQALLGKQLFYDARDRRLSRDSYMSCASCHADAGHDGRTWDFTQFGEGLRNTPALAGRAGMAQGFAHWSANFDEIQDFEAQIRSLAGGTGLMTDAQFNTGTRNTPLGDRKAGVSADLDALAAYLGSLTTFERSPERNADGTLTAAALAGRTVFTTANCASCHTGTGFTVSADASTLRSIGTVKASSGARLGATLSGIDVPTLRDVWATAPYLHDGSAPTLAAAVQAHAGNAVAGADLTNLVAYLQQIGGDEPGPGVPAAGTGTGLRGSYFDNATLAGTAVVTRTEAPWFDWGVGAPASGIAADNFSVRWSGEIQAVEAGTYQFRTLSDDGVRVWINGVQLINNWTVHAPTIDTSGGITLAAGQRVSIVVEFQEFGGGAVLQLSWLRPGGAWAQVPAAQLYATAAPNPPANQAPTVSLTAPAGGTSVTTGTAVTLAATAADADGTVARVEFYAGSTLLGSDITAPYSLGWTPTTAGAVALTARAFDNAGAVTSSAAVAVTVSTTAPPPPPVGTGTGLSGSYFGNPGLTGTPVLTRTEVPWFDWGVGAPAANVAADNFSVRWTGEVQAVEAGNYQFRTNSDDGVRVWVNGVLLINNWTVHAPTIDTSGTVALAAGQRVSIVVEFQEFGGGALLQLSWLRPGSAWVQIPAAQLYPVAGTAVNQAPSVTLTAPAAGSSVAAGTAITLTASAADADGTVVRVEFYDGAALLGTDTTAPYALPWTAAVSGTRSLTARAIDNAGASTTSAAVTLNVTAATGALPAGALAEWTFDGASGTSAADTSGNGRTLTLTAGTSITAAGRAGAGLQTIGPGSPAGASTAAPLVNTAGSFSVSGWIRFDQLPTCWNQILASQDGVTVSGFYLGILPPCGGGLPRATFSMLSADVDASANYRITDTATITTGTWYHLVAVRDAVANTMTLYVNGRVAGTLANPTKWAANGAFVVGRAKFSGGLRDPAYAAIDGVRAYGRALTPAEVATLLQAAR
ncbi:MAG: PA14 domain-containing protein, partial [Aquabacterium sp.]|nr:PA14 domain-containing protein [Aquabacterium sp.]